MNVIKEVLEKLEWSATRTGPGSFMGDNNGSRYPACPICGQLQHPNGDFIRSAVGHKPKCKMKKALLEIYAEDN